MVGLEECLRQDELANIAFCSDYRDIRNDYQGVRCCDKGEKGLESGPKTKIEL